MLRRLALYIVIALCAPFAVHAQTYATVTASNLTDGSGNPVVSGKLCFAPVDASGNPIAVHALGQQTIKPVCAAVQNGAIASLQLANTLATTPANFCWSATLTDNTHAGAQLFAKSGYSCVQMDTTSSWCSIASGVMTCNFDEYQPLSTGQAAIVAPAIAIGTVNTGSPGSPASASVTGNTPNFLLDLTIPQGPTGATGAVGPTGPPGPTGQTGAGAITGSLPGLLLGNTQAGTATWVPSPILSSGFGINNFGTSITAGAGCSVTAMCYANILQNAFGKGGADFGINGASAADIAHELYFNLNPFIKGNIPFTTEGGANDALHCGLGTNCIALYQGIMESAIAWGAIPYEYKIQGNNTATCATSGTWTTTTYGNATGLQSTTPGSTLTCTTLTAGISSLYVNWLIGTGLTSNATISIDGGTATTLSSTPLNTLSSVDGFTVAPFEQRFVIASGVTHTFVITVGTAGTSNAFTFLWAGSPVPPTPTSLGGVAANPPFGMIGGTLRFGNDADSAITAAYDSANEAIANQLLADGAYTPFVNVRAFVDLDYATTNCDMITTGGTACVLPNGITGCVGTNAATPPVHPNGCLSGPNGTTPTGGHPHMAQAYLATAAAFGFASPVLTFPARIVNISTDTATSADNGGLIYLNFSAGTAVTLDTANNNGETLTYYGGQAASTIAVTGSQTIQGNNGVPSGGSVTYKCVLNSGNCIWTRVAYYNPTLSLPARIENNLTDTATAADMAGSIFLNGSGPVTATLPATSTNGFQVSYFNGKNFLSTIVPNSGQTIEGGTISIYGNDGVTLKCVVSSSNCLWQLVGSTGFTNTGTVVGTNGGNATWFMYVAPYQGTPLKSATINLAAYNNTTATAQTITLPLTFTNSAVVTTSGTCTGITVSGATVTLPASMSAAQTGLCEVKGY